jgi:hypothetical protein
VDRWMLPVLGFINCPRQGRLACSCERDWIGCRMPPGLGTTALGFSSLFQSIEIELRSKESCEVGATDGIPQEGKEEVERCDTVMGVCSSLGLGLFKNTLRVERKSERKCWHRGHSQDAKPSTMRPTAPRFYCDRRESFRATAGSPLGRRRGERAAINGPIGGAVSSNRWLGRDLTLVLARGYRSGWARPFA